jgi:CRISPR system Cascade subunit CasD
VSQPARVLALRLAAPIQSWGGRSVFNRRDTRPEPTKSGILGLLAAASGIRRSDPIGHLLDLHFAVRTDEAGSLLRDYHTASDYRGGGLPTAELNTKGVQKTNPKKPTYVTERFYLQDAIFVAAVKGPGSTIDALTDALRAPFFPLALGRRSCPPAMPLVIGCFDTDLEETLRTIPWQATEHRRRRHKSATVRLPATIEDPAGDDTLWDVPDSFDLRSRGFTARAVRHEWITLPAHAASATPTVGHDPFELLGG